MIDEAECMRLVDVWLRPLFTPPFNVGEPISGPWWSGEEGWAEVPFWHGAAVIEELARVHTGTHEVELIE